MIFTFESLTQHMTMYNELSLLGVLMYLTYNVTLCYNLNRWF